VQTSWRTLTMMVTLSLKIKKPPKQQLVGNRSMMCTFQVAGAKGIDMKDEGERLRKKKKYIRSHWEFNGNKSSLAKAAITFCRSWSSKSMNNYPQTYSKSNTMQPRRRSYERYSLKSPHPSSHRYSDPAKHPMSCSLTPGCSSLPK
jgi:hypothetical protein